MWTWFHRTSEDLRELYSSLRGQVNHEEPDVAGVRVALPAPPPYEDFWSHLVLADFCYLLSPFNIMTAPWLFKS